MNKTCCSWWENTFFKTDSHVWYSSYSGRKVSTEVDVKAISPDQVKQEIVNVAFMVLERKTTMLIKEMALPTKVHLVKALVSPVVLYGCESWTIKKAERRRIDAFELWCWRRLLRVPWTARRSNQSILKEFSPGCSLEGLMLKLKLQYFGHVMWRADSFEKPLMLAKFEGGEGDDRGWDGWMALPTRWTWVWVTSRS